MPPIAPAAADTAVAAELEPAASVAVAEPPPELEPPSEAEEPIWTPDPAGYEGMELVYDTTPSPAPSFAQSEHADLVAIPRYALYLQGALLGVVALVAFAIGILTGGALLTQPPAPAAPQATVIGGSVTYASGPRHLPDEGAVIAVIPDSQVKPDEKAPVDGLRPDDPTPGESHRGIAILRELGGAYARTDPNGRFQVRLPDRGRYLVLVISNQKQLGPREEIQTADILKLGPFFDNAADLLGNRRYQLTMESFSGDSEMNVAFD